MTILLLMVLASAAWLAIGHLPGPGRRMGRVMGRAGAPGMRGVYASRYLFLARASSTLCSFLITSSGVIIVSSNPTHGFGLV